MLLPCRVTAHDVVALSTKMPRRCTRCRAGPAGRSSRKTADGIEARHLSIVHAHEDAGHVTGRHVGRRAGVAGMAQRRAVARAIRLVHGKDRISRPLSGTRAVVSRLRARPVVCGRGARRRAQPALLAHDVVSADGEVGDHLVQMGAPGEGAAAFPTAHRLLGDAEPACEGGLRQSLPLAQAPYVLADAHNARDPRARGANTGCWDRRTRPSSPG